MYPSLRRSLAASLVALAALAPGRLAAQSRIERGARRPGQITIQWLGHATFQVTSPGGTTLLLDPFISGNPSTPDSLKNLSRYRPAAILVTHSHDDHALDAKAIAQRSGAKVISTYEWVNSLRLPQAQALGGNVGGTFKVGDVTVHLVPAMHSSDPGGRPLGFVLQFADGRTLYDTGDTWIFGDMSLIQEMYRPSIILLNVGGGPYTEDPHTAHTAITKYFSPTTIIPMHYGTFPGLATDRDVRAEFGNDRRLTVMRPGQTLRF
ncbi:MAG TPA: metal-dependent hydrolase [Gemmatimonadaceae bacterium]|nr:metal-dependent hydrolase [Gemmatimonadaceae bacterium]